MGYRDTEKYFEECLGEITEITLIGRRIITIAEENHFDDDKLDKFLSLLSSQTAYFWRVLKEVQEAEEGEENSR